MTNRLIVVLTVVSGAACSMSVKDDFLAELPDVPRSETADATVTTADSADDTGVASEVLADVPTETTTDGGQTEVITADVVTDAVATETVDAADTSATTTADADATSEVGDVPLASDVVIGPDDLAALGWHSVLPSGAVVGAPIAFTGGVAVPIVNGTAVELRAFGLDGSGKFAATIFIGSAPTVSGGVFCGDGNFYVSGHEPDA